MKKTVLHGRAIVTGIAKGEAVVMTKPLNFGATFYPSTLSDSPRLTVSDPTHELYGKDITGKVLVYPTQHGSTGITGAFLGIVQKGLNPVAIVCQQIDPMMAAGAILCDKILGRKIPTLDKLDNDPTKAIKTGDYVVVDGDSGTVEVTGR